MQRTLSRTLIAVFAAMLLSPVANATWYSYGNHEPDNEQDDQTLMWEAAPLPGQARVYFHAYTAHSANVRGVTASPNLGLVESAVPAYAAETQSAMFGVWLDCNGDGYVGQFESGLREYTADGADDTACPPVTGPTTSWTQGAHNYNGWVSEYVPIAGISFGIAPDAADLRVYRDPGAKVWGDPGNPNDDASAIGGTCPLAPQPRGTYQSTGGFVNYVSCSTGAMARWNEVWRGRRVVGQDVPGADPNSQFIFDTGDARDETWLNRSTFGSEDTQYTALYVVDCEANSPTVGGTINTTLGGNSGLYDFDRQNVQSGLWSVEYPALAPSLGSSPTPNAPATWNRTREDVTQDCDTSNDAGHDFYGVQVVYVGETDFAPTSATNKRSATSNFQFQNWGRGGDPLGLGGIFLRSEAPYPGAAGMQLPNGIASNWNSGVSSTTGGAPGRFARADTYEGTWSLPPSTNYTYYAYLTKSLWATKFTLTSAASATNPPTYGSAQCAPGEETLHQWNCNPAEWYFNPDGSPIPETTPLARVGQAYYFRDVDCQDGHVTVAGSRLQTTPQGYGPRPCWPYEA